MEARERTYRQRSVQAGPPPARGRKHSRKYPPPPAPAARSGLAYNCRRRLTQFGSSNNKTSATKSQESICFRISSASEGSSVMNSMPTEPSWNMAWSLNISSFYHDVLSIGQSAPAVAVRRGRNKRQVRGRTNVADGYDVPLKLGGTSARRPSKLQGLPCSTDLLRIAIGKRCDSRTGIWWLVVLLLAFPILIGLLPHAGSTVSTQPQSRPVEVRRAVPVTMEVRRALPAVPRALPVTSETAPSFECGVAAGKNARRHDRASSL